MFRLFREFRGLLIHSIVASFVYTIFSFYYICISVFLMHTLPFFFLFFAQFLMLALLLCFFLKINIRRKSLNMNWVHMQICWGYQIITWYQKLLAKWQKKDLKTYIFLKKCQTRPFRSKKPTSFLHSRDLSDSLTMLEPLFGWLHFDKIA